MELQNNTEYLNRMAGMLGPDAIAEAAKMPSQALRMVLVVFIVVPIACAYPFFQRYIVSGLTVGSVKLIPKKAVPKSADITYRAIHG
mgnify:CR=1 FL=1